LILEQSLLLIEKQLLAETKLSDKVFSDEYYKYCNENGESDRDQLRKIRYEENIKKKRRFIKILAKINKQNWDNLYIFLIVTYLISLLYYVCTFCNLPNFFG